jgi:hypothetical protein
MCDELYHVELKHKAVQADGLTCPGCGGPVNFITPYYGRDEYDLERQFAGARTWWILVPFVELMSIIRQLTGSSPGAAEKLYHCQECNVDLSYKEAKGEHQAE